MLGDIAAGPAYRFTQWLEVVRKRSGKYRSSGFPRPPQRLDPMSLWFVSFFILSCTSLLSFVIRSLSLMPFHSSPRHLLMLHVVYSDRFSVQENQLMIQRTPRLVIRRRKLVCGKDLAKQR